MGASASSFDATSFGHFFFFLLLSWFPATRGGGRLFFRRRRRLRVVVFFCGVDHFEHFKTHESILCVANHRIARVHVHWCPFLRQHRSSGSVGVVCIQRAQSLQLLV